MNNKSLKENFSDEFKGSTILEFRANGQTVVYGQTPYKEDSSIMVDRLWVDEQKPVYVDNLEQIVKKIYVAVALFRMV